MANALTVNAQGAPQAGGYGAAAAPIEATGDEKKKKRGKQESAEILDEAQERFADVCDRDDKNRKRQRAATRFVYVTGEQWSAEIRKERGSAPTLEFPQLKQFVNQVINDQRQNRPGIRVHPAGGPASKEVSEILQGMVRGIEYQSKAEAAYDSGFANAVVGGRGFWRVCSEYEAASSFDQCLYIKRIADPLTVYPDIDFQEPDACDMNFCFVTEKMKKAEFERRYPKADAVSWQPTGLTANWYPESDEIIVADYYRRVAVKRTLVMMSDGAKGWKDEMPTPPAGVTVMREREADDYRVEWYVLGGGEEILEEHTWPGTMIPIVICIGDEVMLEDERQFDGLISQAMDAQRMYNYEKSAKAENLMLQSKAPWTGPKAAFEGLENIWQVANDKRFGYLPYNDVTPDGRPLPAPTRVMPPQVPTGWVEASQADKDDIKSIIGMYQNSLGMHGQEVSGRAILAREKQGDNSTFHFVDNLSRAIALTGRIIVELIPHYYDTQRIVTTVGTDDVRELVTINQQDPLSAIARNDVRVGDYAVTVEAGPGYATKREEVRESLIALTKSNPEIFPLVGDIIVGTLDFDGASDMAERLKVMLPPPIQQLIAAKAQKQDPKIAAMAAQMQQLQQQAQTAMQAAQGELQKAGQQVHDLEQQLKGKQGDLMLTARKQDAEHSYKVRELDLRSRELDLKEAEAEVKSILEAVKLQQTQTAAVGESIAQAQPAVDAAMHDQPIEQITSAVAGMQKMIPDMQAMNQMQKVMQQMQQLIADLHSKVGEVEKHAKAPRHIQVHFDANGEPIGGTSSAMLQ